MNSCNKDSPSKSCTCCQNVGCIYTTLLLFCVIPIASSVDIIALIMVFYNISSVEDDCLFHNSSHYTIDVLLFLTIGACVAILFHYISIPLAGYIFQQMKNAEEYHRTPFAISFAMEENEQNILGISSNENENLFDQKCNQLHISNNGNQSWIGNESRSQNLQRKRERKKSMKKSLKFLNSILLKCIFAANVMVNAFLIVWSVIAFYMYTSEMSVKCKLNQIVQMLLAWSIVHFVFAVCSVCQQRQQQLQMKEILTEL